MRTLEQAIAGIGVPLSLVDLRDLDGRAVAVGRWQRGSTRYELTSADALRVVLNIGDLREIHHEEAGNVTSVAATPGCVGVLPPERSYRTEIEGEFDAIKIFIDAASLGHPDGGWPDLPPMVVADDAVSAAAISTFVAVQRRDGSRARYAVTALSRAASKLLLSRAQPIDRFHKGGLRSAARRRVERLIERWLESPEPGSPGVEALAAEAGLSYNHFTRAFRQVTGTSPHQHVMARRQQRAMALLGEPELSVADVADQLGFNSPAHFVSSFRKRLGVTPGEYRQAVLDPGGQARASI